MEEKNVYCPCRESNPNSVCLSVACSIYRLSKVCPFYRVTDQGSRDGESIAQSAFIRQETVASILSLQFNGTNFITVSRSAPNCRQMQASCAAKFLCFRDTIKWTSCFFLYLGLFTDVQAIWRPMMGIVNEELIGRDVEGMGEYIER